VTHCVLAWILAIILVWEAVKFFLSLRQQASIFAGIRFERASSPKRFWALVLFHFAGILFIITLLFYLVIGTQK
jgi:hypothetical protein